MTARKNPEDLLPTGRPSKYTSEFCGRIIALGEKGWSKAQICKDFGICFQTMQNWCNDIPEFLEAYRIARASSQSWWEKKASENLDSGTFNAGLWKYCMAARFPDDYSTRVKNEVTSPDGSLSADKNETLAALEKIRLDGERRRDAAERKARREKVKEARNNDEDFGGLA